MYKKEKLCKELKRHMTTKPFGIPFIKHPLLNVLYTENHNIKNELNGKMNKDLCAKKVVYDECFSEGKFEIVSNLIVKPWRIPWLYENKEYILKKAGLTFFYELLGDILTDTECAHIFSNKLLELFYFGGNPLLMMKSDEKEEYVNLPEILKIWRGVESGNGFNESILLGCSWTLDFKQAIWFAKRKNFNNDSYPLIFEFEIKKEDVLSLFTRRQESEIIIDFTKIDKSKLKLIYPSK